jgi:hypothetical protein
MATDDEIREEVSSVGMASETIRPLYYAWPHENAPPALGKVCHVDEVVEIQPKDPSASSGSGSTLSSSKTIN